MYTRYDPRFIDVADDYIKKCNSPEADKRPDIVPSLVGFSGELGISQSTLNKWRAMDPKEADPEKYPRIEEFQEKLALISDLQERVTLNRGASGEYKSPIAKLILARHGYHDSVNQNIGGQPDNPIPLRIMTFPTEEGQERKKDNGSD